MNVSKRYLQTRSSCTVKLCYSSSSCESSSSVDPALASSQCPLQSLQHPYMNPYICHCQENGNYSKIYGINRSRNYSETPGKHTQRRKKEVRSFLCVCTAVVYYRANTGIITTLSSFSVPLMYFFLPLPYSLSLHLSITS